MAFASTRPPGQRCVSAGRVSAALLLSFLTLTPTIATATGSHPDDNVFLSPGLVLPPQAEPPQPADHTFTLRHVYHHGTHVYPDLHRKHDVRPGDSRILLAADDEFGEFELKPLKAKSRASTIERLRDRRPEVVDPMVARSRRQGFAAVLDQSAWTLDDVPSPDVTDRDTILSMAYMAADAYVEDVTGPDWDDVGAPFNRSADFGWEDDGLRGHIWSDETNSTIVIGLKGTSMAVFDGDGTTTKDKVNDNLFFSCCCAQQGPWTWHQVCDCATDTYTCNSTCVTKTLYEENHYYTAARELYSNVTELYPSANIWLAGHSLGGAISSLLALTYGLPAVTFEAVPEALAATRLGLPVPPSAYGSAPQARENTGVFHVGHTADPIYIGTCNGATAPCSFGGYALETTCHSGRECIYDVVADKGWRVGIGTHRIRSVIKDVILAYDDVPECNYSPECRDCGQWKMYESNGTETTSRPVSSTATLTRTRTSTCETPGWWDCLDKSTTTTDVTETTTTTTSTSSTSTCKTPGWFGCKDKTTTTDVTTTRPVTPTSTSTTASTTCETPGKFWGCWDDAVSTTTVSSPTRAAPTPPMTSAPTAAPTEAPEEAEDKEDKAMYLKCARRNWLGFCVERTLEEVEQFSPDEM
ncbi:Alpha/Beta hydrolase protein [Stachybotrys elegans]|uniref:triacylglycerol lipase n=1 Tax=Stachybotrys elegans TaxID=80388 RepID=A0A8K0WM48_9HYPO|nr:Alpha/Beta hydrolase protein [Stachybotrys elegans]